MAEEESEGHRSWSRAQQGEYRRIKPDLSRNGHLKTLQDVKKLNFYIALFGLTLQTGHVYNQCGEQVFMDHAVFYSKLLKKFIEQNWPELLIPEQPAGDVVQ